jgi:hypothetical protein
MVRGGVGFSMENAAIKPATATSVIIAIKSGLPRTRI